MHPPSLNREQARELDRRATVEFGVPSIVLMENAGRGVADKLFEFGVTGPIAVCCGKGNNGGDGFVLARHLDLRRAAVKVLLWAEAAELTGDAAVNFSILEKSGVPIEVFGKTHDIARLETQLDRAGQIVDCLLGTGAVGDPRPPLDGVIEHLNSHHAPKIAVDLPSGLDCDTGRASRTTIRAAHTCSFVAPKPGFFAPGADAYTGAIHVLDIGAPRKLVEACLQQSS